MSQQLTPMACQCGAGRTLTFGELLRGNCSSERVISLKPKHKGFSQRWPPETDDGGLYLYGYWTNRLLVGVSDFRINRSTVVLSRGGFAYGQEGFK
jgi:hypothetical protein